MYAILICDESEKRYHFYLITHTSDSCDNLSYHIFHSKKRKNTAKRQSGVATNTDPVSNNNTNKYGHTLKHTCPYAVKIAHPRHPEPGAAWYLGGISTIFYTACKLKFIWYIISSIYEN